MRRRSNVYDSGEDSGEELWAFLWFILLRRMTHQIFSQNASEVVTTCLAVEISKFHLRELLGLGGGGAIIVFEI